MISLRGGDAEAMTLTQFLDVAYTLLVEEYRRLGAGLTEALHETREYAQGGRAHSPLTASGNAQEAVVTAAPQSRLTAEELENERALAAFEQMMGGVKI